MDHPFHGDPDTDAACAACGQPLETDDERHNYGKVIEAAGRIRPYTVADYDREARELQMPTWAEVSARR